jgi:transposase
MDFQLDLLLDLPSITVEHSSEIEGHIILQLRCLNDYINCSHCGHEIEKINQVEYSLIRDLSIFGKPVFLRVPRRQFHCSNCGKFITERLSFINWHHRYTSRYEKWIYQEVKKTSVEQVSRDEALSSSTVSHIFKEQAEGELAEKKCWDNVKRLSFDEFANRKGYKNFVTTVVDLDKGELIEVINSHKQDEIISTLEKIPKDVREGIEEVSMDMWGGFKKIVEVVFSNADIVYDHFYVIQNVNKELNRLRKHLKVTGKKMPFLLWKNREDLDPDEKVELRKTLDNSPLLSIAYEFKEELRTIYTTGRTVSSAKNRIKKWLRFAKLLLKKSAEMIESHLDGVCNYFKHHTSSGITEGINTKIKLIKRKGYGLPKFQNLRLRLLAEFRT